MGCAILAPTIVRLSLMALYSAACSTKGSTNTSKLLLTILEVQGGSAPAGPDRVVRFDPAGGKGAESIVVTVKGQNKLPEVVRALCTAGHLSCGLDCGQQESHRQADYGDRHEGLSNKREAQETSRRQAAGGGWGHSPGHDRRKGRVRSQPVPLLCMDLPIQNNARLTRTATRAMPDDQYDSQLPWRGCVLDIAQSESGQ